MVSGLGTGSFPLGDMYWKDKGSREGYQQTENGGGILTICAYILKNMRIEEIGVCVQDSRNLQHCSGCCEGVGVNV